MLADVDALTNVLAKLAPLTECAVEVPLNGNVMND